MLDLKMGNFTIGSIKNKNDFIGYVDKKILEFNLCQDGKSGERFNWVEGQLQTLKDIGRLIYSIHINWDSKFFLFTDESVVLKGWQRKLKIDNKYYEDIKNGNS